MSSVFIAQHRRGAAGWRPQLQPEGGPLLAHPSDVQPAQQNESSVEHGGDWRLLWWREVTASCCQISLLLDVAGSDRCSKQNLEVYQLTCWWPFGSVQLPGICGQTGSGLWGTYSSHRLWSIPGPGDWNLEQLIKLMFVYGGKYKKFLCFQPLMREVVENKAEISKQEARDLIERCLKVLYYRDARSYNRVRQHSNMSHNTNALSLSLSLCQSVFLTLVGNHMFVFHIHQEYNLTGACCVIPVWDCHSNGGGCGDRGTTVLRD